MSQKRLSKQQAHSQVVGSWAVAIAVLGGLGIIAVYNPPEIVEALLIFSWPILGICYVILAMRFLGSMCFDRLADLSNSDRSEYIGSGWVLLAALIGAGLFAVYAFH